MLFITVRTGTNKLRLHIWALIISVILYVKKYKTEGSSLDLNKDRPGRRRTGRSQED